MRYVSIIDENHKFYTDRRQMMKKKRYFEKLMLLSAMGILILASCVPAGNGHYGGGGSRPYGDTRVPQVTGRDLRDARNIIRDYDLRVGDIDYVKTDRRHLDGTVERQYPDSGRIVSAGTRVSLNVYRYEKYDHHEPPPHGGGRTEVPRVVGSRLDDARDMLRRNDLQTGGISRVQTNHRHLDGKVESQNPGPGVRVAKGTSVRLSVYEFEEYHKPHKPDKPQDTVRVPHVRNTSLQSARRVLESNRLRVGRVEYRSTKQPQLDDMVFRQTPSEKSYAQAGSTVDLQVYRYERHAPPPADMVTAPRVLGMDLERAKQTIQRQRLQVGKIDFSDTNRRDLHNRVESQSPGPGARLKAGDRIGLKVYRYKGSHGHGGDQNDFVVPNVIGKRRGQAENILTSIGLRVGRIQKAATAVKSQNQVVFKQDPAPGRKASRNRSVDLWIYEF